MTNKNAKKTKKTKNTGKSEKTSKTVDPCKDKDLIERITKKTYKSVLEVVLKTAEDASGAGLCIKCFTGIVFSVMDKVRNDALDWLLTYYKTNMMSAIRVAEELSKGAKNANANKKRK